METIGIKTIKIALTIVLLSVMLFPVSSQELPPFNGNQTEMFDSAPPSSSNSDVTFNGSGPHRAPPPQGGSALGMSPVRDVFLLLPILAILYGIIVGAKRRKRIND